MRGALGLKLDMRLVGGRGVGEVLGPELWVSPTLGLGWTDDGGGEYSFDGVVAGGTTFAEVFGVMTIGLIYRVDVVVTNFTGTGDIGWSGNSFASLRYAANGIYSADDAAISADLRFLGRAGNAFTVTISVKEITSG